MTAPGQPLTEARARELVDQYLADCYPPDLEMIAGEMERLPDGAFLCRPQSKQYLQSGDILDFVPAAALLIETTGELNALPSSVPVAEALELRQHLRTEP
jgi:hypothetical protein